MNERDPHVTDAHVGTSSDKTDRAADAVAACAEGYAFPTNLDRDPPIGGLAPPSQQALMLAALRDGKTVEVFTRDLQAQQARRLP